MGGLGGPATAPGANRGAAHYSVFNLKHAKAEELVAVLQKLFPGVDMAADSRTNAIVARADEKLLDDVRMLLTRLDQEVAKPR
jgi:type II secretory pathway component GspD/PulD (secretin)